MDFIDMNVLYGYQGTEIEILCTFKFQGGRSVGYSLLAGLHPRQPRPSTIHRGQRTMDGSPGRYFQKNEVNNRS